jgi:hypothetical protein
MSENTFNKVITTVNSVTNNYTSLVTPNSVIVIDTSNNRIGINTLDPNYEIHVSGGTIFTENLRVNGSNIIFNNLPQYTEHNLEYGQLVRDGSYVKINL